jgi:hypothetical protein
MPPGTVSVTLTLVSAYARVPSHILGIRRGQGMPFALREGLGFILCRSTQFCAEFGSIWTQIF